MNPSGAAVLPFSSVTDVSETADPRLLSRDKLDEYKDKIYDDRAEDLAKISRQLIEHIVALDDELARVKDRARNQVEQARDTLATSTASHDLDRQRWDVERNQLVLQSYALAHKLSITRKNEERVRGDYRMSTAWSAHARGDQGSNANEPVVLPVDVRYYKQRLEGAEAQVQRLQAEIRRLRPYYLHGAPLVTNDTEIALTGRKDNPRRPPTLGDAEAEHLLLAGKTLSHVRRINRVPLDSAIINQAEEIVRSVAPPEDRDDPEATPKKKGKGKGKRAAPKAKDDAEYMPTSPEKPNIFGTPRRPAAAATAGPSMAAATALAAPEPSTPGRLSDLLQAARSVETGSAMQTGHSVKRRRIADADADEDEDDRSRRGAWRPSTARALQQLQMDDDDDDEQDQLDHDNVARGGVQDEGRMADPEEPEPRREQQAPDALTALDVLAQASASQHATSSQSPEPVEDDMTPLFDGAAGSKGRRGRPARPPLPEGVARVATESASVPSPLAPGIDINSIGKGGTPKPLRSPYVKWNANEDELLVKAVIKHGLRWDQVSAEIPTRTYHQVRQRFLRGLKNGKTLPRELAHLGEEVRETVRVHDERKKEKKLRIASGGGSVLDTPGTPDPDLMDDDDEGYE